MSDNLFKAATKLVNLPIRVPVGNYCWDGRTTCPHFDNHGGHGVCDLGFGPVKLKDGTHRKDSECMGLDDDGHQLS